MRFAKLPVLIAALLAVCLSACRPTASVVLTLTPPPAQADPINRFYQKHGGSRVFGLPLTGRRLAADGAMEQVFENAVLHEDPAAPEGVSLRPLGLRAVGQIEPPAPKLDVPNSAYSARYGHNIIHGIYTFYQTYGGEAVFGAPLTEVRIESDRLVQYFENVVITWDTRLASDQSAQLMDLGRQTFRAEQSPPTAIALVAPTPTALPTPTESPSPPTPAVSVARKTYRDEVIGFAIDYPETWTLWDVAAGFGAILASFPPDDAGAQPGGGESFRPGETKCDLYAYPEGDTLDNETNLIRTNVEITILSEQAWELEGGTPAVRFQLYGGRMNETAWLFAEMHGRVIAFVCYGALTPFDEIARTLRPITPANAPPIGVLAFLRANMIWLVNADGSGETRLSDIPASRIDWSPDGARLAFYTCEISPVGGPCDDRVYVVNVDGSGLTRLTNDIAAADFAWSPDGTRLALADPISLKGIFLVNNDGSNLTRLTDFPALDLDWSPDGTRLVFTSDRDGHRDIYTISSDGTGLTNLTNSPADEFGVVWSPDGARLALLSYPPNGRSDLYVMNVDGSGQINLTNSDANEFDPVWSPDGMRLAFYAGLSLYDPNFSAYDVYVVNADGTGLLNLSQNPANDFAPDWSPDGRWLAFVSTRDGYHALYLMSADGSGLTRLTDAPEDEWQPVWRPHP